MRVAGPRASDVKLIVGATVAVLLAGFFIAGAALVATRGGGNVVCNELNVGAASDIRRTLQNGGPYFQTGGAGCGFWLALDDNDIVAYKVKQPSGCTLKLKRDHWECGGVTVPASELVSYPVTIKTLQNIDAVIVDLRPAPEAPTTTRASSPPRP
jgi:hypothetical protein